MPQGEPAVSSGHTKKSFGIKHSLFIGAGIIVLGGIIMSALFMFSSKESSALNDILSQNLPRGTKTISMVLMKKSDVAISSSLSQILCGGVNVDSLLRVASILPDLSKNELLSLKEEGVRTGLQCGEQARKMITSSLVVSILFEQDDDDLEIVMIETNIESLPLPKHTFSGFAGHCTAREDDEKECDQQANAAFREGGRWVVGKFKDIDIFARVRASSREHDSTNVEILRKAATQARIDDLTVLRARPDKVPWSIACADRKPYDEDAEKKFLVACLPDKQERVYESINTKVRAVATSQHTPDDKRNDALYSRTFTLLARDEDAAEKLVQDIEDLVRDWKSHVSNKESALIRIVRDASGIQSEAAALIEPFIRAMLEMTIAHDGEFVTVRIETELSPAEMRTLREAGEKEMIQASAREEIHQAILAGDSFSRPALAIILGEDIADWVLAKRATADDCKSMTSQLSKILERIQLQPEQYGIKFNLEKQLAEDICVGMVLEQSTKECLGSANNLEKFAECFPPIEGE